MNFLCSIINPKDVNNTDSMQFLGLTLINTIIEVMGSTLQNSPRLLVIVTEDLTRYLLQNLQSDNVSILALNIRVFFNVFFALRSHVKYQLELFFNDMLTLLTNKQVAFELKEVVLEILVQLCKDTTFLVDLYINFDCNLQCNNLFEKLLEFLYKVRIIYLPPPNSAWTNTRGIELMSHQWHVVAHQLVVLGGSIGDYQQHWRENAHCVLTD